jgi:DNA polymerase elongation subunit (family B)
VVPDRKPKEEKEEAPAEKAQVKKTRVVKKPPQCDHDLVEEKLHEFLLAMSPDELAELNEHLLADGADDLVFEDTEAYIDAFGGYLRNNRPEVMNWIIQTCTTEEEETIEIELEDVDDPTVKIGKDGRTPVVGAYVAQPKKGIHREVGCIDINSLYPSAIRALNMSPETIVGQVRPDATMALVQKRIEEGTDRAEAWDGIFSLLEVVWMHEKSTEHTFLVDFEDGRTVEMNGQQLNDLIFTPSNNLCISANGTIFSTVTEGIIPHLLAKWYSERKTMQAREKSFGDLAKGVDISEELANQLRELECAT